MDEAIALIDAAAAKQPHQVATPGYTVKPIQTGQPKVPAPAAKAARVIRVADLSSKASLETEAEVDAYVGKLKTMLLDAIRAGQRARVQ